LAGLGGTSKSQAARIDRISLRDQIQIAFYRKEDIAKKIYYRVYYSNYDYYVA